MYIIPKIAEYQGVSVARDLIPGGTKGRYISHLYKHADEIVYASSAEGGAQSALAATAQRLGKKATVFGPLRATPHPRQLEVQRLGGKFVGIKPGYLNVVQARARAYAEQTGSMLAPFGMLVDGCTDVIAETAQALKVTPDVVWCAAGSGTLARGLQKAWPRAELHIVQVGAEIDVEGAVKHVSKYKYSQTAPESLCPFDTCGTYERKAWQVLKGWRETHKKGFVLFWSPMLSPKT